MTTDNGVALQLGQRDVRGVRQWWTVVTTILALAILAEAIFAGAMLSGVEWALRAHAISAGVLIAATLAAGLVAIVTLRRIPRGPRLALSLLALAAAVFVQAVLGAMTAKGANLLWLHVPVGAALVGFGMQAINRARSLGEE